MKILNISQVLPSPAKQDENDILLVAADNHERFNKRAKHIFVVTIPFVVGFISLFSESFKRYYELKKMGSYEIKGRKVQVVDMPMFRGDHKLRGLLNWLGWLMNKRKLSKIVQNFRPDIIHAHTVIKADAYYAYKLSTKFNIPYVVSARYIRLAKPSKSINRILNGASSIVSIGYAQKESIDRFLSNNQSILIPHGVDDRFFSFSKREFEIGEIDIISLCKLLPVKNIDQVILALAGIDVPYNYHIYGEGVEQSRLETLVESLGLGEKIIFKGKVDYDKVPEILSNYDIFVVPSFPETFGRVYSEAMAVGLPVVASRGTGIDGYVVDGISALLVDHSDIQDIRDKLKSLISNSNLRREIGRNGEGIAREFTWSAITKKLDTIYEAAINKQSSILKTK